MSWCCVAGNQTVALSTQNPNKVYSVYHKYETTISSPKPKSSPVTLETKCILLFAIVARRSGVNIKLGLKVESKVFSTYQEHLTCYVGHKISDHMTLLATNRSLTQWCAKIQGLIPGRKFNTYFFHFKMGLNLSSFYSIDMQKS